MISSLKFPDYETLFTSVEEVIRKLPGVTGISNSLAVANPDPLPSPDLIRQTIEQALERRAEREARKIHIEVIGTNVILSGIVHSLGDQIAVVNAVAHAPGVCHIEQNVAINPYL